MRLYLVDFGNLDGCMLCVATTSSYEFEMDTEKQRQRRRNAARLTESGSARSEQLLMVRTEPLTNREWLLEELLSGSECRRPGWLLDMKYQTCLLLFMSFFIFSSRRMLELRFAITQLLKSVLTRQHI